MVNAEHSKKVSIACREGKPDAGDMVLSVMNPYALMIVEGWKPIENRTWSTDYRGLLWIHASRGKKCLGEGWQDEATGNMAIPQREVDAWQFEFGAIIGAVYLAGVYPLDLLPRHLSGNVHAVGPYCWHFTAMEDLPKPVPYSGKVSLFKYKE